MASLQNEAPPILEDIGGGAFILREAKSKTYCAEHLESCSC